MRLDWHCYWRPFPPSPPPTSTPSLPFLCLVVCLQGTAFALQPACLLQQCSKRGRVECPPFSSAADWDGITEPAIFPGSPGRVSEGRLSKLQGFFFLDCLLAAALEGSLPFWESGLDRFSSFSSLLLFFSLCTRTDCSEDVKTVSE